MTKEELISKVAEEVNLPKSDVENTLEAILQNVIEGLKSGEKINLRGFGNFSVIDTKARKGRNPQTGEEIEIPASKKVKFSVGSILQKAIKA